VGAPDVDQPTPSPTGKQAPVGDDEAAAALLLELQDNAPSPAKSVDSEGIPTGSTVMEIPATAQGDTPPNNGEAKKPEEEEKKKKAAEKAKIGDTAVVANELLQKYLRRPRKPTV
jgi:hypothetical protein